MAAKKMRKSKRKSCHRNSLATFSNKLTQFSRCLTWKIAQHWAGGVCWHGEGKGRESWRRVGAAWCGHSMRLYDTWRLCFRTPHKALKCHFRRLKWRPATPTAQVAGVEGGGVTVLTLESCSSPLLSPPLRLAYKPHSHCPQANKATNGIDDGDKLECLRLGLPPTLLLPAPASLH